MAADIFMSSGLLESVIVTEFQTTEALSSSDLTKANYIISRLSMVERENAILRINSRTFLHVKKRRRHDDENEVDSQYVHSDP
jgi:hypothetical protein